MKLLIKLLIILAIVPSVARAFDGQRDGFTLDVLPGITWITSSDYATTSDNGNLALTPSISLGWGLNQKTAVSLNFSLLIYSADWNDDIAILTSTAGLRHYFREDQASFYAGAAAGISLDGSHSYDGSPAIAGYLGELSAGYLFGHFDSQLRFSAGKRFLDPETLTMLSLSVGYLLF